MFRVFSETVLPTVASMIVKCVENGADECRRFQPMEKGISVKIEEKAPIREPHLARHTKAETHFRKWREILDRLVNRFWRGPETANFYMSVGEYDRKKGSLARPKGEAQQLAFPRRERSASVRWATLVTD